jgi:hypothetical protein
MRRILIEKARKKQGPKRCLQPPPLESNLRLTRTYRFLSTSASEAAINQSSFLAIAGAICTATNSTTVLLARSCKIHSIKMWSPGVAGPTSVSIEWTAGVGFNRAEEISDTTVSTAIPAHVSSKPPHGSFADFEFSEGSSVPAVLKVPADTVVDVHITHWFNDTSSIVSRSVTAGNLGEVYYFALDGAANTLVPVGLKTTN